MPLADADVSLPSPKQRAAFQFGVKMNDGRRKGNIKKKKKTEDAKINEQLQKINQFSKSKDT